MAVDLTPRLPKKVEGGHGIGGSHLAWSPSDLPMLLHANIGAAKLALEKNGKSVANSRLCLLRQTAV